MSKLHRAKRREAVPTVERLPQSAHSGADPSESILEAG